MNDQSASFTHVDALHGLLSVDSFSGADLDVAMRASLEVAFRGELEISRKPASSMDSRVFIGRDVNRPASSSRKMSLNKVQAPSKQDDIRPIVAASYKGNGADTGISAGSIADTILVTSSSPLVPSANGADGVMIQNTGNNNDHSNNNNNSNSDEDSGSESVSTVSSSDEDETETTNQDPTRGTMNNNEFDTSPRHDLTYLKPLPEGIPRTRAVSRRWENLNSIINQTQERIEGKPVSREIIKVIKYFCVIIAIVEIDINSSYIRLKFGILSKVRRPD